MVELKKEAQKGIKDPVQQKLRQKKKQWSKDTSVLIAQLIALKRGLNGKGDPQAGLPPSNIKDPLPEEISTYLNQMIKRFEDITGRASQLISDQEQYSQTRKKSRKETGEIPGQQVQQPQPEQQMPISASNKDQIEKLARIFDRSDSKSRLWTWVTQYPLFTKEKSIQKEKIRLMYAAADFENQINEIEYILTSFDKNAPAKSFYEFSRFLILFERRFMSRFSEALQMQVDYYSQNKENIGPPPPPQKDVQKDEIEEDRSEERNQEDQAADKKRQEAEQEGGRPEHAPNSPAVEVESTEAQSEGWDDITTKVQHVMSELDSVLILRGLLEQYNEKFKDDPNAMLVNLQAVEEGVNDMKKLAMSILKRASKKLPEGVFDDLNTLTNEYNSYVSGFISTLNADPSIKDVSGVINWLRPKTADHNVELIKLASKHKLQRWMQRVRLSIYSGEYDRSRLETARLLRDVADDLDMIEYMLESKDTVFAEVAMYVRKVYVTLQEVCGYFVYIGKYHNYVYGTKRLESGDANLGQINTGQIRFIERFSEELGRSADDLEKVVMPSEEKGNG